ncbi:MAG TPA: zinc-dependent metalloprotease, partial [Chthonomonadales bacterium]|nr:zinc-dependent metalloprotease [Chthonomonadales bacterium]
LYRIQPDGAQDMVLNSQRAILLGLLNDARINRMLDNEALNPGSAYSVQELVATIQHGIWSELMAPRPTIDLYRRNLQRAYLDLFKTLLTGDGAAKSDLRPIARGALQRLQVAINQAIPRTTDPVSQLHLRDCSFVIDRILNPRT